MHTVSKSASVWMIDGDMFVIDPENRSVTWQGLDGAPESTGTLDPDLFEYATRDIFGNGKLL